VPLLNYGQHNPRVSRPCVSQGTGRSVGALERVSHRGDPVSCAYSLILAQNHAASVLEKVIKDMAGD
jgi:hypothetical protein